MNISNLILQLFGGALTGYITNTLAIKMLFKSYGPFGGVIVKTREEFVENISQLVERDIINENTLADSLVQSEVKKSISKMVEHFFTESLQTRTQETFIEQIPEIKQSTDNLIYYLENSIEDYYIKGSQIFLPKIRLKQIVSNQQYDYISQQFTSQFLNILNKSKDLRLSFNSLLSDLSHKDINSLFTPELINLLTENIKDVLREIEKKPEYIYKNLNVLKGDLNTYLNTDELNKELIKQVQCKTLKDYHLDEKYLSNIKNNIVKTINSQSGPKVVLSIYENITESLTKEKHSISDFINLELKNDLNRMIDKKITGTIDTLKPWLLNNHSRIDDIFNRIINNVLEEESKKSPWKSAIKKSAYDYYRKNSSTSPTEILTDSLDKLIIDDSLNSKLEDYLYQQLDNTNLNDILSYLQDTIEQHNKQNSAHESIKNEDPTALDHDQSSKIARGISLYLSTYLSDLKEDKLKSISEKTIDEIIDLNKLNLDSLINIFNNNQDIENFFLELLLTNLDKGLDNLVHNKLDKFINIEQSNIYYDKLNNSFKDKQGYLQQLVKRNFYKKNENKTLAHLINPQIEETSILYLKKIITTHFKLEFQKKNNNKINDLVKSLSNRTNFNEKVSDNIIYQINNNLPVLLKGNISAAIKNNLEAVSDDNIKDILEDFVGKELKPITYFGAFLGLCSASLLYLLQINTTLIPSFQIPVSMLVYGFIGYITNVIAIKMVFKPYAKKKLLGIPLPFTPGVVSKEKNRFAQSVGKFIDEELLNYNTVKNTIQNKKIIIKQIFTKSLTAKNYQLPRELLIQNSEKISAILFNNLQKNQSNFVEYIVEALKTPGLEQNNQDLLDSLTSSITEKTDQYIEQSIPLLSSSLLDWLKARENLSSVILDPSKRSIRIGIEKNINEKINSLIELLTDDYNNNELETVLSESIDHFYQVTKNKNLGDLSEESRGLLSNILYSLLGKITISKSNTIKSKLNTTINTNKSLIHDRIPQLLLENKSELKDVIIAQAEKKLGFWSAAGKLVDFDDTLDKFTDSFIEEGLAEILNLFLEEKLEDIIREWQFDEKEVSLILRGLLNNQTSKEILVQNIDNLIEELSFITLDDLFKILEIEKPSKLIKIFSQEINLIKNTLVKNLSNNKGNVVQNINKVVNEILEQYLYNIDINKLLRNIDNNMIKNSLELSYKQLNTNDLLSKLIYTITKEIITMNSNENQLINANYLNTELNKLFKTIFTNPIITRDLKKLINEVYIDLIKQIPEIIDKRTADYLIELLITSILNTLEEGLPELIKKINIKDITITEIDNMDPKEIEELFYSFAGSYFGKLESYGWLGSIVGLLSEIIKNSI